MLLEMHVQDAAICSFGDFGLSARGADGIDGAGDDGITFCPLFLWGQYQCPPLSR